MSIPRSLGEATRIGSRRSVATATSAPRLLSVLHAVREVAQLRRCRLAWRYPQS